MKMVAAKDGYLGDTSLRCTKLFQLHWLHNIRLYGNIMSDEINREGFGRR
jgi:hypothetical protein